MTGQAGIEACPLEEVVEDGDELLRISLPVGTARAFVTSAREITDAGRPFWYGRKPLRVARAACFACLM